MNNTSSGQDQAFADLVNAASAVEDVATDLDNRLGEALATITRHEEKITELEGVISDLEDELQLAKENHD